MNHCLRSSFVAIAFGFVCLATTLSPQALACDQCGHSSCTSCAQPVASGCTSCGGGCDGACQSATTCYTVHCDDEGILDKSATVLKAIHNRAKSLFGIRRRCTTGCDSCDQASCDSCQSTSCSEPSCGVEPIYAPQPMRLVSEPSCGCEQSVSTGSCGCYEVTVCDAGTSRGLLSKFLKRRDHSAGSCDNSPSCGCEPSEPSCGVETNICDTSYGPSCGCESVAACDCGSSRSGGLLEELLRRRRAAMSDPSCGCEVAPSCGCEATTTYSDSGCQDNSSLFGKLFSRAGSGGCGCGGSEPSCGCETQVESPSCGCETNYSQPTCGAEASIGDGCSSCQSGSQSHMHTYAQPQYSDQTYSEPRYGEPHYAEPQYAQPQITQPNHLSNPAPVVDPHVAAPGVTPAPIQPMPSQTEAASPYQAPTQTPVEMQPVPAPAPPTVPRSEMPRSFRNTPDSEINPFLDDAVNRVRRVPTRPVNYRMNSRPVTPEPSLAPYGETYDPQANNTQDANRAVRFRLSDVFEKLDAVESRQVTALAANNEPVQVREPVVELDPVWKPRSKRHRHPEHAGQGSAVVTASATR